MKALRNAVLAILLSASGLEVGDVLKPTPLYVEDCGFYPDVEWQLCVDEMRQRDLERFL